MPCSQLFYFANVSLNAIREYKIPAKISKLTVKSYKKLKKTVREYASTRFLLSKQFDNIFKKTQIFQGHNQSIKRDLIRVLSGLDSDQDQHSIGSDLGPNCLQKLSDNEKNCKLVRKH